METVSVIIPTYKNRGGLVNSIESVLSQDYPGLVEVIVVDDNNPDSPERKSTEVTMDIFSDNPKVKYIRHLKNRNGSAARNTGLNNSSGTLIAFLDDDDLFLKDKLSKQVEYLNMHLDVSAVYCHAIRGNKILSPSIIEGDGTRQILLLESNFQTSTILFRKNSLMDIHGFDESFIRHQDYELMLRFFAANFKIGCLPKILVEIGKNDGENVLSGIKLNSLKKYFFDRFDIFIGQENERTPGFKNKVYAIHYAGVFLNHIKHKNYTLAYKAFMGNFFKNPKAFSAIVLRSLKIHLKGEA